MMTIEQRVKLITEARKLLGTPFRHAGRNEFGLDCIGLLVVATRNAGMQTYDNPSYSSVVDSDYMQKELAMGADKIENGDEPLPGDVILFNIGKHPQHVAMISDMNIDNNDFMVVHSYQTVGRVVEHWLDTTWKKCIAGFYTWRPS